MQRGTTPTHTFTLPIETRFLQKIRVTYKQGEEIVLEKTEAECKLDGNNVIVELTQEETLMFAPHAYVSIQLRVKTTNSKVLISDIMRRSPQDCLNDEVL